jgi:predicted dehydrogenase
MRVGIVGSGIIGTKRGMVITESKDCELVSITAEHVDMARPLAKRFGCKAVDNWLDVLKSEIDAVVVATPPHIHAEISIEAMKRGIHVLCEKPIATSLNDAKNMNKTAHENNVILKCGFNHRHHPAIRQIKKWIEEGKIGTPTFIRSVYGIGARHGIKKEWRSNPTIVAGGQLMEQGIHCIDLMRWIVGNPAEVSCLTSSPFSMIEPLEDNAFVTYKTEKGQLTNIHSSVLQWKNLFSFEVFGTEGYANVNGLGGSYGLETATLGKKDQDAPFADYIVEFRGPDQSWALEWKEFQDSIAKHMEPEGNGHDGYEAMRLVFAAYKSSREKRAIDLTSERIE